MTKWESNVVRVTGQREQAEWAEHLFDDNYGKQGWELVAVTAPTRLDSRWSHFFKRPLSLDVGTWQHP
jgi:hypothetical protein